ncbi:hypothetical protein CLOM_g3823 [Closterium sp. NIES-68]|nr:hypothetical protein CLOM_g3823 [Closterium sp. NIES-68]
MFLPSRLSPSLTPRSLPCCFASLPCSSLASLPPLPSPFFRPLSPLSPCSLASLPTSSLCRLSISLLFRHTYSLISRLYSSLLTRLLSTPLSRLYSSPLSRSLSPRLSNGEEHSASAKLAGTGNREGSGKRGRAAQRALGSESLWKVATWRHGKVGESLRFARAARSGKQREAGPALQPTIAKGGGKWVMGSGRKLGGAAGAGNCSQDAWVHSR